jgi:hypothetical protein
MSLHAQITQEALGQTLGTANLKAVIDANDSQDASGEGAQVKRRQLQGTKNQAALG